MKKIIIIVLSLMIFLGCSAKNYIPKGATLIDEVDDKTVVFELQGQLFLFIRSTVIDDYAAITKLDEWHPAFK